MTKKKIATPADELDECENQFGYYCPKCKASDELDVVASVAVRLTEDGTDADESEDGSHSWDEQSPCTCVACGFNGVVAEFDPANWKQPDPALAAANLAKLPEKAFVTNTVGADGPHGRPPILAITRGEAGYNPIYTNLTADELNEADGVTKPQARAMYNGSLFGWDAPAADPDNPLNSDERNPGD